MIDIEFDSVPYRTPACDKHLIDNNSNQCPWCHIEELKTELKNAIETADDWFDEGTGMGLAPGLTNARKLSLKE